MSNFFRSALGWFNRTPSDRAAARAGRRRLRPRVEPLEERVLLAQSGYLTPGLPGQTAQVVLKPLSREALFRNEVGIFRVDNSEGHIDGLRPGDPGYVAAALADARRSVLFRRGAAVGAARTATLPGGSWFGLYLVPDGTTRKALARSSGDPAARGHVLFSYAAANPGERPFARLLSGNRVAFEDSLNGDRDFNDFVGRLAFHPPQGNPFATAAPPTAPASTPTPAPVEPPNLVPSEWTVPPPGGSPAGRGGVTFEDGEAVLREGDSFEVRMERGFAVPAEPSTLTIEYRQLSFDRTGRDAIRDAFEAAFLDGDGSPLSFTSFAGRDSFFNTTEDQPTETAPGAADNGLIASLNLANLPAGTVGTLVLRLVNNDGDTNTSVRVRRVSLTPTSLAAPAGITPLANSRTASGVDPATLEDVSPSLHVEYLATSFNQDAGLLYADVRVRNRGQYAVAAPLLLGVDDLSDPSVAVREFDGRTAAGMPFYDLGAQVAGGVLRPGEATAPRRITFFNPDRTQFTYALVFLGRLNRPPAFHSAPDVEALAGRPYAYAAAARDPDEDGLRYGLVRGPIGMAVDADSGLVTWNPTAIDVGSHSVVLRVEDGRGGADEQFYTLMVRDSVPNRPPIFTSVPAVEARVNSLYSYQAAARDEDGDPLSFALVSGPDGMNTTADGLVTWTPNGSQAGPQTVSLSVSDGRGGIARQIFTVVVGSEAGNRPPVIFSDPVTEIPLLDTSGNPIQLNLGASESATVPVTFTLPSGLVPGSYADIAFVVDESVSMIDEHDWLAEMVEQLDAALLARGVGPNRFSLAGFNGANLRRDGHLSYLDGLANDRVTVYGPDNRPIGSGDFGDVFTGSPSFRLPTAGTYTVVVSADAVDGSPGFQMRVESDPARAVATTGLGVVRSGTLAASEVQEFTFTAPAGLPIYLDVLSDQVQFPFAQLRDPDGETFSVPGFSGGDAGPIILNKSGTYTLLLRGSATGPYSFRLLDLTASPEVMTGMTIQGTITSRLESHFHRFTGTKGQRLFIDGFGDVSSTPASYNFYGPTGQRVTGTFTYGDNGPFVLPEDGEYYFVVQAAAFAQSFQYGFRVLDLADAEPLTLDTETSGVLDPGQGSRLFVFQGIAGQRVYLDRLAGNTSTGASLFGAGSTALVSGGPEIETVLPADGPYFLVISGGQINPANYRFRLVAPETATLPLTPGTVTAGSIAVPGETDVYTFPATAGQQFYYDGLSGPGSFVSAARLVAPSGLTVAQGEVGTDRGLLTVPETGLYRLAIDFAGDATGDYQFRLLDVTHSAVPLAVGAVVSATPATPQAADVYSLDLAADQRLYFDWRSASGNVTANLLDPSGRSVVFLQGGTDGGPFHAGRTGTYRLIVSGAGATEYSFRLHDAADATPVAFGATVSGTFDPGREARLFRIDAAAGQRLHFDDLATAGLRTWRLYSPGNRTVGNPAGGSDFDATPGQAGSYLLVVAGNQTTPFDFSFRVTADDQTPVTPSGFNTPISGTLQAGDVHTFTLTGTAGMAIYADSLAAASSNVNWGLTASSGAQVFSPRSTSSDAGTFILTESGTYTLTLTGVGGYDVRLLDLETAATDFSPNTLVNGTLAAGTQTHVYRLTTIPGQLLYVRGVEGISTSSLTPLAHDLSSLTQPGSSSLDPYLVTLGGDKYLFAQASGGAPVNYTFTVLGLTAAPAAPLDTLVTATLDPGRTPVAYTVSAAAGQRLFFESLSSFSWQLYDRSGRVVARGTGNENDFTFTSPQADDYVLVLEGSSNSSVTVNFRIATPDTTTTPLTLGTPVNGTLAEPGEIDEYTFQGAPGQQLYFDSLSAVDAKWVRLIAPSGQSVFDHQVYVDANAIFLREAGTYRLAIDARGVAVTGGYSFRLFHSADTPELLPGVVSAGAIDDVNETDVLRFQGTIGQRIWLDVVSPDNLSARLTLRTPTGEVVYQGNITDAGPFTLPQTGSYELTISGQGSAGSLGGYALRIVDAGIAPVLPQPQVTGTLDSLRHGAVYRIDARAGEVLTFRPGEDTTWGTAAEVADAVAALPDNSSGGGDSYDGIEVALAGLTFRPGAATRVVLITQNARTNHDQNLTAGGVLQQLSDAGAALTVVVPNALRDEQGNAVLGLDANGANYRADGSGGVLVGQGGAADLSHAFNTDSSPLAFAHDYLNLIPGLVGNHFGSVPRPASEQPGSSAWSLEALRAGGQTAASFAEAFLQSLVGGTLEQLPLTVVASDPSVPVANLTGVQTSPGGTTSITFDIRITGDGLPHRFDLNLVHAETGEEMGSIPVVLSGSYRYDTDALDPDGDAVTYRLLEAPAGADIDPVSGLITWDPDTAGQYPFRVQADDGRGGRDEQAFTVTVTAPDANRPPHITSTPAVTVFDGVPWSDVVVAVDPDDDPLTYQLTQAPAGMTIDEQTGAVRWVYGVGDFGEHDVTVRAVDPSGAFDEQTFRLTIAGGVRPGTIEGTIFDDTNGDGLLTRPIPTTFFGPFHYVRREDSPFDLSGLGVNFFLEDFEDHEFNLPGVTQVEGDGGVASFVFGPDLHDSVDADDGVIDGSGLTGDDWYGTAFPGFTFAFDPEVLGGLPTRVGLVDTDGVLRTVFEAFDQNGDSLGVIIEDPPRAGHAGPTSDDRFYGVIHSGGISKIHIESGIIPGFGSGLEFDHLQYGFFTDAIPDVDEPGRAGAVVYLDADDDGFRDPDEIWRITDAQGRYRFEGLPPAEYTVRLEAPTGQVIAAPQAGFRRVTVTDGESFSGLDFSTQAAPPPPNRDPSILSTPPTTVAAETTFRYRPAVTDLDGDTPQYDLPVRPEGMAVDPISGLVVWGPTLHQLGVHDVVLRVRDGKGGVALQHFQVTVGAPDTPPVITSSPTFQAVVGRLLEYPVQAQDAEGTALTYRVDAFLPGVTIDRDTGVLRVTPVAGQEGVWEGRIVVTDATLRSHEQIFFVNVVEADTPNVPPAIASTPRDTTHLGSRYLYDVGVVNADFDPLTFSLTVAPAGMTIGANGRIAWEPTSAQLGSHAVTLLVDDGRGGVAQQSFTVAVVSQAINRAPVITSTPRSSVAVSGTYVYDAVASDPDNDPLEWHIASGPEGMSVGPRGTVRWTPRPDHLGVHEVVLEARDPQGGVAEQRFIVTVRSTNLPPIITTSPPTEAFYDRLYVYAVGAVDPEGDALTYTLLVNPPPGLVMDANGVIRFTPPAFLNPDPPIIVRVTDGQGGMVDQEFTIALSFAPNQGPEFTSTPPLVATAGVTYEYALAAPDPDNDPVTFSLQTGPAGMTLDAGVLRWTPTAADLGDHQVIVTAFDPFGLGASQTFPLRVLGPNRAPSITSTAIESVTAGLTYRYDVRASDPDNEVLTFALTDAPAGMTIDARGRITWETSTILTGSHSVEVTVTDARGLSALQAFDVTVQPDTVAPNVRLVLSRDSTAVGAPVTAVVTASDNGGVPSLTLTVDGVPMALDANGRATIVRDVVGSIDLVATARDAAGNIGTDTATLLVIDPNVTGAPVVSLTSPEDGAEVTAPRDVIGTADDDNLLLWTLAVAPVGSSLFTDIASGTTPVIDGVLGRFDPSLLPNDSYVLRLTATDAGGNTSTVERIVHVTGNLKLGNFTLSFTDMTVPVSGIPIQVTRSYDTLQASHDGDLGFGWRLEFRDTRLRTNLPTTGLEAEGIYTPFRDGTKVYITLPGGRREGFTFRPQEEQLFFTPIYLPRFIPDHPDVQLTVPRAFLTKRGGEYFAISPNGVGYNPADPVFGGTYELRTKDATRYEIDARTGDLLTATDLNGNTLTFSDSGIVSSAGEAVTFARDPRGRIVSVIDPAGNPVRYGYDDRGDLVSVTDRVSNTTRFVYNSGRAHYLDRLIDPAGRTGVHTEYDPQGRLVRLTNAEGKAVQMTYNPDHNTETILDARGNPTTLEYDERGNVLTETNALGGVTRRTYDAADRILSETDPLLNTTVYTYDAAGNRLSDTDPMGATRRYVYGPNSQLVQRIDALGNSATVTLDPQGNPMTGTLPVGGSVRFASDQAGNLTTLGLPDGSSFTYAYDQAGRPIRRRDPLGNETTWTYDANGNRLTETTHRTIDGALQALTTRYAYDAKDRLISVTDARGGTWRFEYDELDRETARIDALGRRTSSVYDAAGRLVRKNFPDDTFEVYEYDAAGNRIAQTDGAGRTTRFEYDALNRLVTTRFPDDTPDDETDNPRTRQEYDAAGHVTAEIDANGHRTDHEYDRGGRRVRTIGPAVFDAVRNQEVRPESRVEYDLAGNSIASVDANGQRSEYAYDAANRLIRTTFSDGTTQRVLYDALGQVLARTDQAGVTTSYAYDPLGDLISVTLPSPGPGQEPLVTRYSYDEAGNLLSQTDALDRTTRFSYDELGRRVSHVLPMGQTATFAYDAVGNLTMTTDFNDDTTTLQYDAMNQLVRKLYPDGSTVAFTYTPTGKQESVVDARGTTTFSYDAQDRMLSRTEPDGRSISYAYDEAGNRTSMTTPAGATTYTFDRLNRLVTVTDPSNRTTHYGYDTVGNLVRTELPNGTVETRRYDDLHRLVFLENAGPNEVISSYRYTLGPTGMRTAVLEHTGRQVAYAYDEVDRLISEAITDPVAGNRTISYSYDAVGNRLTRDDSAEGITTYVYDENDRLRTETLAGDVTEYTYDASGNMLSKSTSPTDQAFYHWDSENRLVNADADGDGTVDAEYQYDAEGNRVTETINGQETRFLLDSNRPFAQVVVESGLGGAVSGSYVYGLDLISQNRDGVTSFYHADGLGSTTALTDVSGIVTDQYRYDAFGRTLMRVGGSENRYLFTGEQFDSHLGANYLRARYYDMNTGRFLSTDPFQGSTVQPETLHRYVYTANNPVNNVDPSGKYTLVQVSATVGIIAGLTAYAVTYHYTGNVLLAAGVGVVVGVSFFYLTFVTGGIFLAAAAPAAPAVQNASQNPAVQAEVQAVAARLPTLTDVVTQLFRLWARAGGGVMDAPGARAIRIYLTRSIVTPQGRETICLLRRIAPRLGQFVSPTAQYFITPGTTYGQGPAYDFGRAMQDALTFFPDICP